MTWTKWFIYVLGLGLLPTGMRLLIWFLSNDPNILEPVTNGDLVGFGLAVTVTNITAILGRSPKDSRWADMHIGLSVMLTVASTALYVVSILPATAPIFDKTRTIVVAGFICAACCVHSFAVWYRLILDNPSQKVSHDN